MNTHFVYITILVVVIGFVIYLKNELDATYGSLEAFKRSHSQEDILNKEKLKKIEDNLSKCKVNLKGADDKHKVEYDQLLQKLEENNHKQEKCYNEKQNFEQSLKNLQDALDVNTHEKVHLQQNIEQCNNEKQQIIAKVDVESASHQSCLSEINQCNVDKSHWFDEHEKLKVTLEQSLSGCEAVKNNEAALSISLQQCQNNVNNLQENVNQLSQTVNTCIEDKQKCEADKLTCLYAAEEQATKLQAFADHAAATQAAVAQAAAAQQLAAQQLADQQQPDDQQQPAAQQPAV